MARSFYFPIQVCVRGRELKNWGGIAGFGKKRFSRGILDDYTRVKDILDEGLANTDYVHAAFGGNPHREIGRVVEIVEKNGADVEDRP